MCNDPNEDSQLCLNLFDWAFPLTYSTFPAWCFGYFALDNSNTVLVFLLNIYWGSEGTITEFLYRKWYSKTQTNLDSINKAHFSWQEVCSTVGKEEAWTLHYLLTIILHNIESLLWQFKRWCMGTNIRASSKMECDKIASPCVAE